MNLPDPDVLYERFTAHQRECVSCAAHGEMCPTGRRLLREWGDAERAWVGIETVRPGATDGPR